MDTSLTLNGYRGKMSKDFTAGSNAGTDWVPEDGEKAWLLLDAPAEYALFSCLRALRKKEGELRLSYEFQGRMSERLM